MWVSELNFNTTTNNPSRVLRDNNERNNMSKAMKNHAARQQRAVEDWNQKHPNAGVPVTVRLDSGAELETKTTSQASLLGGHSAVIWLEGVKGCYALERVSERSVEPAEASAN